MSRTDIAVEIVNRVVGDVYVFHNDKRTNRRRLKFVYDFTENEVYVIKQWLDTENIDFTCELRNGPVNALIITYPNS
jgi:hypothetical protein